MAARVGRDKAMEATEAMRAKAPIPPQTQAAVGVEVAQESTRPARAGGGGAGINPTGAGGKGRIVLRW
jgi:hypothetical protein